MASISSEPPRSALPTSSRQMPQGGDSVIHAARVGDVGAMSPKSQALAYKIDQAVNKLQKIWTEVEQKADQSDTPSKKQLSLGDRHDVKKLAYTIRKDLDTLQKREDLTNKEKELVLLEVLDRASPKGESQHRQNLAFSLGCALDLFVINNSRTSKVSEAVKKKMYSLESKLENFVEKKRAPAKEKLSLKPHSSFKKTTAETASKPPAADDSLIYAEVKPPPAGPRPKQQPTPKVESPYAPVRHS